MNAKLLHDLNEHFMFDVLNSLEDGIWILDKDGNVLWVNDQVKESFKEITDTELLADNVMDMEERGIFFPSIARLVIEHRNFVSTVQVTKNNVILLVSGNYIPDENGHIKYIITHARELSKTLKATIEPEKTEALLQQYRQQMKQVILQKYRETDDHLIGQSKAVMTMFDWIEKVADVDTTILLTGETGVGKSTVAHKIHQLGNRNNQPFIHLNCGAIPETLLESELFGYKKGAFTGASHNGKPGLIAAANRGTLFLDEIAEFPLRLQVKLLQFLQNKTYLPLGDSKLRKADVRIIAATNASLQDRVKEGSFRADLFYRLNILPFTIPPLREHKEDIIPLVHFYLQKYNQKYGKIHTLSEKLINALYNHRWEGNIRELENLLERLVITTEQREITLTDLPKEFDLETEELEEAVEEITGTLPEQLEKIEKNRIMNTYKELQSTRKTAQKLGVSQSYIIRRLKKYNLTITQDKELVEELHAD
ncbi:sigma-54 interaction domain-containing protein [Bacillus sp. 1P06AnD]|uniref:sigma-54 interaction domain-containing protein n=1 Tax=Bacillus sp. 1P06AnD TaxID=3132208 RepID=UPI0039A1DAF8